MHMPTTCCSPTGSKAVRCCHERSVPATEAHVLVLRVYASGFLGSGDELFNPVSPAVPALRAGCGFQPSPAPDCCADTCPTTPGYVFYSQQDAVGTYQCFTFGWQSSLADRLTQCDSDPACMGLTVSFTRALEPQGCFKTSAAPLGDVSTSPGFAAPCSGIYVKGGASEVAAEQLRPLLLLGGTEVQHPTPASCTRPFLYTPSPPLPSLDPPPACRVLLPSLSCSTTASTTRWGPLDRSTWRHTPWPRLGSAVDAP